MNTQEYAKKLVRTNGLDKSKKIAQRCMNACAPDVWEDLPKGRVFVKDMSDRKATGITLNQFNRTHGFWTEVLGLLNKMVG